MSIEEIKLENGSLQITPANFVTAKALYQALLEEGKSLKIDPEAEVDANLFKDVFCAGLSSKKIEACLKECMKTVSYNGFKASENDTWEPQEARVDYFTACFEVTRINIQPFTKNLYAQYQRVLAALLKNGLA